MGLREFIPLGITLFAGLVFLALYQNVVLYVTGVLDTIFGKSFFLLVVHHLGFASVCALLLAFLFNFLEGQKPHLGLKLSKVVVISLLVAEGLLTTYYIQNYEALGSQLFQGISASTSVKFSGGMALIAIALVLGLCYFIHKKVGRSYLIISRMYPVTLILFSMFLATLASESREVNENKIQHLMASVAQQLFSTDHYGGEKEYPLLRAHVPNDALAPYFAFQQAMPHIKLIVIEGLGSDFIGKDKPYSDLMPYLNQLQQESLFWPHFLSNTGEGHASVPTLTGSLPFGKEGFTKGDVFLHRNTLFSVLRANGYETGFAYGGNSTLFGFDKFLDEEEVGSILDKNAFGATYEQQAADAAGISLGYPDAALYHRYQQLHESSAPRFDVLLTLSTKAPYQIPEAARYQQKVSQWAEAGNLAKKTKRFIGQHLELFASYSYADGALRDFMAQERKKAGFENTLYIITGTHYSSDLPQENRLARYRVPFLVYGPLVKKPARFPEVASHADVAPTLIALLETAYPLKVPQEVAWLGHSLPSAQKDRALPFLRGPQYFQEFLKGNHFFSEGDVFELDDTLGFSPTKNKEAIKEIGEAFEHFKGINAYVMQQNKILPEALSLVKDSDRTFTKEELVWIHSVFNGDNFDNAYTTAHTLAMDKEWDRAKLLCSYILNEIPRHADTELLLGRLHGWQKDYATSISLLEKVVRKYPKYGDAYCALMDSYYWAGQHERVAEVRGMAQSNAILDPLLNEKFERAEKLLEEQRLKEAAQRTNKVTFQE